ncbi:phytanoyl-CoA dioxygenase family protein [Gammaproteobacteria bacterium]|nr:phytanoyl-CoA dioxygenase family protein [Gammaproteobacteria bacterium]
MFDKQYQSNKMLVGENALDPGISQSWERDNQAWWDWYVTLAENKDQCNDRTLVQLPPIPDFDIPSNGKIENELNEPYHLTDDHCLAFQRDGFVKLQNVLSGGAVVRLRQELLKLLNKTFEVSLDGGANNRFLSLEMMWMGNALIKSYVLSPRIAKISADLLGVKSVRLYHDNALAKQPGCGRTPWHCDDHHFPLATQNVVTAWIPAQPIPPVMGPLAFAKPLSVFELVKDIDFNKFDTSYDKKVAEVFHFNNVKIEDGPFAVGEVSFHHNRCFHTAAGNRTTHSRIVLANTFFESGARVVEKPTMVSGDWQKFIPGVDPGCIAASELNPVCWPANTERKV